MNKGLNLTPLFLINVLSIAVMMSFIVIIGPIVRLLGMQEWHGGLLVAIAGLIWLMSARRWGNISDGRGRKPILIYAIAGFSVSYLLLAVFIDYAVTSSVSMVMALICLAVLRGFIGGFYAAVPTVSSALIADHFSAKERTSKMAVLGAGNAFGMILGPLAASLVVTISLAAPMYLAAFLPLIALFVVWKGLPNETVEKSAPVPTVKLLDARLRLPMITAMIAISTVITAQISVGFFAIDQLNLSGADAAKVSGYAMTAVGVVLVFVQIVMTKLPHITPKVWLAIGAFLAATAVLLMLEVSQPIHLILVYGYAAIGLGLMFPAMQAMAANSVTAKEQGVAAGTLGMAQGFGMVVSPMIATFAYDVSPFFPYVLCGIFLLLLTVLALLHKPSHQEEEAEEVFS